MGLLPAFLADSLLYIIVTASQSFVFAHKFRTLPAQIKHEN
jgi:hypothetical protein